MYCFHWKVKGNELDWSPDTSIVTSIWSPGECRYINGHISAREQIGFVSHFFLIQKEREKKRRKREEEMRGRKDIQNGNCVKEIHSDICLFGLETERKRWLLLWRSNHLGLDRNWIRIGYFEISWWGIQSFYLGPQDKNFPLDPITCGDQSSEKYQWWMVLSDIWSDDFMIIQIKEYYSGRLYLISN